MPTNRYKEFDPADYLDGMDDVVGYLEVALAESAEDPTALPRALGVIARSQNMSELAPPSRHEPRRALQGTVSGRQPDLVHDPQGHQCPRVAPDPALRGLSCPLSESPHVFPRLGLHDWLHATSETGSELHVHVCLKIGRSTVRPRPWPPPV